MSFACGGAVIPADAVNRDDVGIYEQRWYSYHLPYCLIEEPSHIPVYYWYPMANYVQVPAREIQQHRSSHPEQFREMLHIEFELPGTRRGRPVYSESDSILAVIAFGNYGTDTIWVRLDRSDLAVHQIELIRQDRTRIPVRKEWLLSLRSHDRVLSAIEGDRPGGIGGEHDLAQMFEIPGPGTYRFRYRYVPPPNTEALEYNRDVGLRIWNGKRYVDYFEFVIEEAPPGSTVR